MTKQEIALELTKIAVEKTAHIAHRGNNEPNLTPNDLAKKVVEAYNTILSQINE